MARVHVRPTRYGYTYDAGGGGEELLTVTPGDHENNLAWPAFDGASSVKVYRDFALRTGYGTPELVATLAGAATSYRDAPDAHFLAIADDYTGGGLPYGIDFEYTVAPIVGGIEQAGVTGSGRPASSYVHPEWPVLNGYAGRDHRNLGHLLYGGTFTSHGGGPLDPGDYTGVIFAEGIQIAGGSGNVYNLDYCWVPAVYNFTGATNTVGTLYRCTLGLPFPAVWNDYGGDYDHNDLFQVYDWSVIESCIMHGGSQLFAHLGTSHIVEDVYQHSMCASIGAVDPHMDGVWVSFDADTGVEIRRWHAEGAAAGMSSMFGPGASNGALIEDSLLNTGSANGAIVRADNMTLQSIRFKRAGMLVGGTFVPVEQHGGYVTFGSGSGNNIYGGTGTPTVDNDNRWADNEALV